MAAPLSVAGDARSDASRRPLRVLWLIDSLTMGGAESLAVSFAHAAAHRTVDLTVCARTTIGGNPLEGEIRAAGGTVENLGARNLRDLRAFRRLLRLIRQQRFDVIHAHLTYSAIWAALASIFSKVPVIATLHVPPPERAGLEERLRQRLLTILLNWRARRVVLVSDALRTAWGSRLRNTTVVYNGIPMGGSRFGAVSLRRELRIGEDALLVITVAVLREGKGIDVLIRAVRNLSDCFPNAHFLVVGDGPMREEWRRMAAGLPLTFTGWRRDVARLLAAADLFVLPTLSDALPTVLLEAMAASLPIVASDVGGVPEIVGAGTGMLVPPGDEAALADAIATALGDARWRASAGAAGRARVAERFSVDRWADSLIELYAEVHR